MCNHKRVTSTQRGIGNPLFEELGEGEYANGSALQPLCCYGCEKERSPKIKEQRNVLSGINYGILLQTAYEDQTLYSLGTLMYLIGCTQAGQG